MSVRTVNSVTRAGLSEASLFAAADAGGDLIPNDGNVWLEYINASGGVITGTINALIDGVSTAVRTFSVPATTGRVKVGRFPPAWNNASGQIAITYSAVTSLTMAAFTMT